MKKNRVRKDKLEVIVEELQEQLEVIPDSERHEWLRTLYSNYTNRFTTDNGRIWGTGGIMIPLSLSGFVAFTSIDSPTFAHAFVIGITSISLMTAWILIAENHRAFQDRSLTWIYAIERLIGVKKATSEKLEATRVKRLFVFSGGTQWTRIALLFLVIIGWFMIWIVWPY